MRDKLISKLKKLLRQAEGEKAVGNQAASEVFAQKVQELLSKHKLSMSDIDVEDEVTTETVDDEMFHATESKRRVMWQASLIYHIAKANNCRSFSLKGNNFRLIGTPTDRELVKTLFNYFRDLAQHLATTEARSLQEGVQFKNSYLLGFAHAVGQRMIDANNRVVEQAKQLESSKTALVRTGNTLAQVNNYVAKNIKVGKLNATIGRRDGYSMGQAAGARVVLSGQTLK